MSFAELLHHAGAIPLPPYLKREAEESDTKRYQTIYAAEDGSVAAPTAGLHFTKNIFEDFKAKNIQSSFVTLHVGAGTFKPVKSETMAEHEMHAEFISVPTQIIRDLVADPDRNIIAVGTTSLRTLESLYWLGVKLARQKNEQSREDVRSEDNANKTILELDQWEAYILASENIPVKEALTTLLDFLEANKMDLLLARTRILIAPGYEFKIINALITNFHQPQSTLLLLVAALIGKDWKKVYDHALTNDFRFLSYGDGSLLWKNTPAGR
jgi:S-adenosylmethionine:tRNA ribosyltransferase-isomerase